VFVLYFHELIYIFFSRLEASPASSFSIQYATRICAVKALCYLTAKIKHALWLFSTEGTLWFIGSSFIKYDCNNYKKIVFVLFLWYVISLKQTFHFMLSSRVTQCIQTHEVNNSFKEIMRTLIILLLGGFVFLKPLNSLSNNPHIKPILVDHGNIVN
jgi:hypothetical protein